MKERCEEGASAQPGSGGCQFSRARERTGLPKVGLLPRKAWAVARALRAVGALPCLRGDWHPHLGLPFSVVWSQHGAQVRFHAQCGGPEPWLGITGVDLCDSSGRKHPVMGEILKVPQRLVVRGGLWKGDWLMKAQYPLVVNALTS